MTSVTVHPLNCVTKYSKKNLSPPLPQHVAAAARQHCTCPRMRHCHCCRYCWLQAPLGVPVRSIPQSQNPARLPHPRLQQQLAVLASGKAPVVSPAGRGHAKCTEGQKKKEEELAIQWLKSPEHVKALFQGANLGYMARDNSAPLW